MPLSFTGRVEAEDEVAPAFRISGWLLESNGKLRDRIQSEQVMARLTEIVRRFDGFVAKYTGERVLVYFGYPHAREDDAEQTKEAGTVPTYVPVTVKATWLRPLKVLPFQANPYRLALNDLAATPG